MHAYPLTSLDLLSVTFSNYLWIPHNVLSQWPLCVFKCLEEHSFQQRLGFSDRKNNTLLYVCSISFYYCNISWIGGVTSYLKPSTNSFPHRCSWNSLARQTSLIPSLLTFPVAKCFLFSRPLGTDLTCRRARFNRVLWYFPLVYFQLWPESYWCMLL